MSTYTRNPKTRHFHRMFTWCAACEHVHTTRAWAELAWQCPRCRAPAIDARPWEEFRRSHPACPEQPTAGRVYAWDLPGECPSTDTEPAINLAA